MKKKVLALVLALVLCISLLPTMALADEPVAQIVRGGVVAGTYETLEAAVNAAQDNDVIKILPGTFDSNCHVNKNLNLTFEGSVGEDGELLTTLNVKADTTGNGNGCLSLTDANKGKTFTVKNINFTNTNHVSTGLGVTLWPGDVETPNTVNIINCVSSADPSYLVFFPDASWHGTVENCTFNCPDDTYVLGVQADNLNITIKNNIFKDACNSTLIDGYPTAAAREGNTIYVADKIDSMETSGKYGDDGYLAKLLARLGDTDKLVIKEGQDIDLALLFGRGDYTADIESAGTLHISEKASDKAAYVVSSQLATTGTGTISITGGTYAYDPSQYGDSKIDYVADGYEAVKNDGVETWTVKKMPVAQIVDGEKYMTLAEAISNVTAGTSTRIKMLNNTVENVTIPAGKTVVLDLAGKNITATATDKTVITNNGTLTIKDSAATGTTVPDADGNVTYASGAISGGKCGIETNGTLTIEGGTIENNHATSSNAVRGAGISVNGAPAVLNITGGLITENTAPTGQGGGIGIYGSDTKGVTINISGGAITKNSAASGGAIALQNGAESTKNVLNVSNNAYICNNTSTSSGGGIYAYGNYANINISGGTIARNSTLNYGGGIRGEQGAHISVSGGLIDSNESTAAYSGGVYCDGKLTVTGGTISNNTSDDEGSEIYVNYNSGAVVHEFTMSGGTVSHDNASHELIYVNGGKSATEPTTLKISGAADIQGYTRGDLPAE